MYDLPSLSAKNKKDYIKFKNNIESLGFIRIQFSIYVKLIHYRTKTERIISNINQKIPETGNVRLLIISEKQYESMILLLGEQTISEIYNRKERYVKI